MFGHITDLPRFHNFQDAVEQYKNTKGVRGREHIKPLKTSRRSPDLYRIEAEVDGGGNVRAVACYLYRTAVLTYTPDRLIVYGFNSQTTNRFIDSIAPHWLRAYMRNNEQVFCIRSEGEFLADTNNKLVVHVDEKYMPVGGSVKAAKLNSVVLNKTRAAKARKSVKDVVELARVTSKMDGYWQGLVESSEEITDHVLGRLRGILWARRYQVKTFERLKQHLYKAEYDYQECYDYAPAPYGVIPKTYEVAR
jgi:hypothetical protein